MAETAAANGKAVRAGHLAHARQLCAAKESAVGVLAEPARRLLANDNFSLRSAYSDKAFSALAAQVPASYQVEGHGTIGINVATASLKRGARPLEGQVKKRARAEARDGAAATYLLAMGKPDLAAGYAAMAGVGGESGSESCAACGLRFGLGGYSICCDACGAWFHGGECSGVESGSAIAGDWHCQVCEARGGAAATLPATRPVSTRAHQRMREWYGAVGTIWAELAAAAPID
eukprot:COSAG04_NODE_147_length_22902_cov_55.666184_1_plen_233_part_00